MMATPSQMTDEQSAMRERILEATERSILEVGIQKTRVEQIASEVGLLRPNVYRYISGGKEALILQVLLRDMERIHEIRRRRVLIEGPLAPLLVDSLVMGFQSSKESPVFRTCLEEDPSFTARVLTRPEAVAAAQTYWCPILDHGRARGELRNELGYDEIVRWFLGVQFLLHEHHDFFGGPHGIQEYIRKLVIPAVVT
jgi:AcrR family transcriptional regulator